jgi:hypothetical protein
LPLRMRRALISRSGGVITVQLFVPPPHPSIKKQPSKIFIVLPFFPPNNPFFGPFLEEQFQEERTKRTGLASLQLERGQIQSFLPLSEYLYAIHGPIPCPFPISPGVCSSLFHPNDPSEPKKTPSPFINRLYPHFLYFVNGGSWRGAGVVPRCFGRPIPRNPKKALLRLFTFGLSVYTLARHTS